MEKYLLAHDLGTSGDKATLFNINGKPVKSSTRSYPVHYFGGHCAEQDPSDWWKAFCEATKDVIQDVNPFDILGVSFSAQMQCCLPVDRDGRPLRPAIIWADHRAVREKDRLVQELGFDRIYEITGHRPNESYTLEKIMWLKANEPDIYSRTYKFLQVKDFIINRLTGAFVTDFSDASGTNAFDLVKMDWSPEITAASDTDTSLLPDLHASTDIAGKVTEKASEATGLSAGTPVICGGGDGPCSAVGAGCIEDNRLFATFGTSAWIGGTTEKKFVDDDHILMCFAHVIPGKYMPCGTMQAAGSSYSWIRDLLEPETSYGRLNEMIASAEPGSDGLLFLPYLTGERSPRWNEKASGAFLGIRMNQTHQDYLRAVIEAISLNLELILQSYRKYLPVDSMILTGGGARGESVCQILADVMNCRLETPDHVDTATSIAAAVIAGVGTGVYSDFSAVSRFLSSGKTYEPEAALRPVYGRLKKIFDDSYHALVPIYEELDEMSKTT